jgi:hypothetical protein
VRLLNAMLIWHQIVEMNLQVQIDHQKFKLEQVLHGISALKLMQWLDGLLKFAISAKMLKGIKLNSTTGISSKLWTAAII